MTRDLKSFKVQSKKKILDYRLGRKLDLVKIKLFFQRKYNVKKIWDGDRHVLGILSRDNTDYFLKLAKSEGISVVTRNEYEWNEYANKNFPKKYNFHIPKNYDNGLYKDIFFYLITDYFEGNLLCGINEEAIKLVAHIDDIILLSELVQKLPGCHTDSSNKCNYQEVFIEKVNGWFNDIPADIRNRFEINVLLDIVNNGLDKLNCRPRHGDFTSWHMIKLKDKGIGLIDGEHAKFDSVEGYDICYFIQRVFSVLKNPIIAKNIYSKLLIKGYKQNKLKTILAARAIGGFLDESLVEESNYSSADKLKNWILQLD